MNTEKSDKEIEREKSDKEIKRLEGMNKEVTKLLVEWEWDVKELKDGFDRIKSLFVKQDDRYSYDVIVADILKRVDGMREITREIAERVPK